MNLSILTKKISQVYKLTEKIKKIILRSKNTKLFPKITKFKNNLFNTIIFQVKFFIIMLIKKILIN